MRVHWLLPISVIVMPAAYATQYMTVTEAQKAAFPDATQFVAMAGPDAATVTALGAAPGWTPHVFDARNGDAHLGYVIVDQVIGKSEAMTYALAIDARGAVVSLEILQYRESHGGEVRIAGWRKQFAGKTASAPPVFNKDIKNISGATLSCRHLTEGVQRLLAYYAKALT